MPNMPTKRHTMLVAYRFTDRRSLEFDQLLPDLHMSPAAVSSTP